MAFDIAKFKLIGKSESSYAPNIYQYSSPDLKATINTATYFNNVAPYSLKEGDIIIVTNDDDGTIRSTILVVSDVTSGAVTTVQAEQDKVYFTGIITDISTSGSYFVVCPVAGTISKIHSVIDGTIATANAALSFEIGGVAVTDGGITVAYSGSAAGDVDTATPTAANTVTAGQAIEMITNGASTNTIACKVTFEITLS